MFVHVLQVQEVAPCPALCPAIPGSVTDNTNVHVDVTCIAVLAKLQLNLYLPLSYADDLLQLSDL